MDFNNIFTNTDMLGLFFKEELKKSTKKAVKSYDNKEMQKALLKLQIEVSNELIAELEGEVL